MQMICRRIENGDWRSRLFLSLLPNTNMIIYKWEACNNLLMLGKIKCGYILLWCHVCMYRVLYKPLLAWRKWTTAIYIMETTTCLEEMSYCSYFVYDSEKRKVQLHNSLLFINFFYIIYWMNSSRIYKNPIK